MSKYEISNKNIINVIINRIDNLKKRSILMK